MPETLPQETAAQTLYCLTQNRLGALDRVLGTLTHRGVIPLQLRSIVREEGYLEILIHFHYDTEQPLAEKALEKLLKAIQKQIYVLETRWLTPQESAQYLPATNPDCLSPLFVSDIVQPLPQRRMENVHHA